MHYPRSAAYYPAAALNHTHAYCSSECLQGYGCGGKRHAFVLGYALHAALVRTKLLPKAGAYDDYTFDALQDKWCSSNPGGDPWSVMEEEDVTRVVCEDDTDDEGDGPAMYVRLRLELNSSGMVAADQLDFQLYRDDGQLIKQRVLTDKREISICANVHADIPRILIPVTHLHMAKELVKQGDWYILRLFDGRVVATARAL